MKFFLNWIAWMFFAVVLTLVLVLECGVDVMTREFAISYSVIYVAAVLTACISKYAISRED